MLRKSLLLLSFLFSLTCLGQFKTVKEYIKRSNHLSGMLEYEEAVKVLTNAIHQMPDSVILYSYRASLFETLELYKESIDDLTSASEKTNDAKLKSHFLARRGVLKSHLGNLEGSYQDLVEALRINPDNTEALIPLTSICDEVNRPDETLTYLERIVQLEPHYIQGIINLGIRYLNMGEHEKAIKCFDQVLESQHDDPLTYVNRSFSKLKTGDIEGAMQDINYSIELLPTNSYAFMFRALIYIEANKTDEACEDLAQANRLGYTPQYGEEVNTLIVKYCK